MLTVTDRRPWRLAQAAAAALELVVLVPLLLLLRPRRHRRHRRQPRRLLRPTLRQLLSGRILLTYSVSSSRRCSHRTGQR